VDEVVPRHDAAVPIFDIQSPSERPVGGPRVPHLREDIVGDSYILVSVGIRRIAADADADFPIKV